MGGVNPVEHVNRTLRRTHKTQAHETSGDGYKEGGLDQSMRGRPFPPPNESIGLCIPQPLLEGVTANSNQHARQHVQTRDVVIIKKKNTHTQQKKHQWENKNMNPQKVV